MTDEEKELTRAEKRRLLRANGQRRAPDKRGRRAFFRVPQVNTDGIPFFNRAVRRVMNKEEAGDA